MAESHLFSGKYMQGDSLHSAARYFFDVIPVETRFVRLHLQKISGCRMNSIGGWHEAISSMQPVHRIFLFRGALHLSTNGHSQTQHVCFGTFAFAAMIVTKFLMAMSIHHSLEAMPLLVKGK